MQISTKFFSKTFLIFIPSIVALFFYVYGYTFFPALSTGVYLNPRSYPYNTVRISIVGGLASYIPIIVYGLYPLAYTSKKYAKRYRDIAIEFEFIKKILFVGIPLLVISITIDQLFTYLQINSYLISHYLPFYDFSFAILISSTAVVIGALLRLSTQVIKKEFRFYLGKGYCIIASKNEEEGKEDLDKIKYLVYCLDSYNKYLLRKIKFGIKNIDKIYSDIIIQADAKNKDEFIKSICQYLGGEDRLKLATYLSTVYKVPDSEQFFVRESLMQKLRPIGVFLVAAIPIIISIIQLASKSTG